MQGEPSNLSTLVFVIVSGGTLIFLYLGLFNSESFIRRLYCMVYFTNYYALYATLSFLSTTFSCVLQKALF